MNPYNITFYHWKVFIEVFGQGDCSCIGAWGEWSDTALHSSWIVACLAGAGLLNNVINASILWLI